ncbi:MAG: hypothetical protein GY715_12735 [Planctomycetes bacterium]|nr:hypothetical protein [Planctomycetota bacterium]
MNHPLTTDTRRGFETAFAAACAVCLLIAETAVAGGVGAVLSHQKISATAGGFNGVLESGDAFGRSAVAIGDLDGNGGTELAIGAERDDDGGNARGAVWLAYLAADGTVLSEKSAPRRASSRVRWTTTTSSGARSRRWAISTTTACPTWRWARATTTTA